MTQLERVLWTFFLAVLCTLAVPMVLIVNGSVPKWDSMKIEYPPETGAAFSEDKCFDFDGNPHECFLEVDLDGADHSISFGWEPEFALVVKNGRLDIQMKDDVTMTDAVRLFLRLVNESLPFWKKSFCDCPTCLEEPTMGARLEFHGVW